MTSSPYPKSQDILNELNQYEQFDRADEPERVAIMNGLKLEIQPDKVLKTLLYEAGIFPHTKHGIINPSCVLTNGNNLKVIYRTEPSEATWTGYLMTDKGVPQIASGRISRKGIILTDPKPIESGMPLSCRPEDWRLFSHNNRTYVNFTNYFYYDRGWPQKTARCVTALGVLVEGRIQFVREVSCNHLNIPMKKEEKNWVFFSHNDLLYCLYSCEPWIVFRCDDTGKPHEIISADITLPRLGNKFIANSTNPILVNIPKLGSVFLMFVHQYMTPKGKGSRNRTYYQHILLIDPDTMLPIAWTPYPIVGGGMGTKGRHDGVIYISGAFTWDNKLYALAGEGDTSCVMFELTLKDLSRWITML